MQQRHVKLGFKPNHSLGKLFKFDLLSLHRRRLGFRFVFQLSPSYILIDNNYPS